MSFLPVRPWREARLFGTVVVLLGLAQASSAAGHKPTPKREEYKLVCGAKFDTDTGLWPAFWTLGVQVLVNKLVDPDGFNPFKQPHYILLNLAIGGDSGGDPLRTFPKRYVIDYVRVYQKQ